MKSLKARTKRRAALWVTAGAMAILLGIVAYALASTVTGTLSIDQTDINAPFGYYVGETVHLVATAFNDNGPGSFNATIAPPASAMAADPGDKKADVHVIMPDGSYKVIEATGTNIPLLPGQKIQWKPNEITITGPGTFLGTPLPHTYLRSHQTGQGDGTDPVPVAGMFDYPASALQYTMTGNEPHDAFGNLYVPYEASGIQVGTRGTDYWHAQQTINVFELIDHTTVGVTVSKPLVHVGESVDTTITEFNGGTSSLDSPFVVLSQTGQPDVNLNAASASLVSSGNGDGVLDVGETWTWVLHNVTINSATTFTAVGHGLDPRGNDVTFPADPQNPAVYEDPNEKASADVNVISPNTLVSIAADPTMVESGGLVTWTVTEKNTGDATLTAPYVNVNNANVDAAGVAKLDASSANFSGDTGSDGKLSPNEIWTWTFTENPTVDEHYWAFGHGMDPLGMDISFANNFTSERADAAVDTIHPNTLVSISADPHMVETGGLVTWTVTEKNTGDATLTTPYVNVNDANVDTDGVMKLDASSANFSGDTGADGKLSPNEIWTWTFTENPTASEHYWAFGHGIDPLGKDISFANGFTGERSDDAVTVLTPGTLVNISVDPSTVLSGGLVTWTVTEKNTGDTTLTAPFVNVNNANVDAAGVAKLDASSPNFSGDTGSDGKLSPNEIWTWTFTENPTADEHYWAFGHGLDALDNDISFANGFAGERDEARVTILKPDTLVSISADPHMVESGGLVTWTVTEKNTGDATLTAPFVNVNSTNVDAAGVAKLDDTSANFSGDTGSDGMLSPDEIWTWTFTENPTAAEHYWAFGHGTDPLGNDISFANGYTGERDDDSITVLKPDTLVNISADPTTVLSGGLVTWTVTEKNTGDTTLTAPYVNVNSTNVDAAGVMKLDDTSANFSGDTGSDGMLSPDEIWTWTFTENPTAAEHYWAFGHGLDTLGNDISFANGFEGERDDASITVLKPNTTVTIAANPHMVSSGGLVTWTVTEKNTGDTTLTAPFVNVNNTNTDAAGVVKLDATSANFSGDTGSDGMLSPDEIWTWTFTDNPTAPETLWAFGHGKDALDNDISFGNGYTNERASDSVQIQGGATRTPGYWQTHAAVTNEVMALCGGSLDIGWAKLNNYHETLGVLWSTPSKTTTGVPRKKLAQAKIILSTQLISAELNDCLPNGDHSAETTIGLAITALKGTDTNLILTLAGQLDAFNNSGDNVPLQGLTTTGPADTGGTTNNKDFTKPNKLIIGTEGPFL